MQKERRIDRRELEAVIRRAAELYALEADASERLSETEVMRIGAELGLPATLVQQALYELPDSGDASLADRAYGRARTVAARAVSGPADPILHRLQDYLTTREFLQLRRSKPGHVWLEPAGDAVSRVARALSRPARRWHVARARRVVVSVRPLGSDRSHVRIELDSGDIRRRAITGGALAGAFFGIALGAGAGAAAAIGVGELVGPVGAYVAGAAAGVTGLTGGLGAGIAASAARFRRRTAAARLEIEGLLDRLERGERLEPPPAPWRRRLQLRAARKGDPPG